MPSGNTGGSGAKRRETRRSGILDFVETGTQPGSEISPHGQGHIFISYSRWDQDFVSHVTTWLRAAGMKPWICGPGKHSRAWQDSIAPGIAGCAALLVLATPRSRSAAGVAWEVDYAKKIGKPVIPLSPGGWHCIDGEKGGKDSFWTRPS